MIGVGRHGVGAVLTFHGDDLSGGKTVLEGRKGDCFFFDGVVGDLVLGDAPFFANLEDIG